VGVLAGPLIDEPVELVLILPPAQGIGESLLLCPSGVAYGIAEVHPFLIGTYGYGYPSIIVVKVAAPVAAVGSHEGVPIAAAALYPLVHGVVHNGIPDKAGECLILGAIYVLPLPRREAVL
jgi:hypothetical protein